MVMAAADADTYADREVPATPAALLFAFNLHKPQAIDFTAVVQLFRRILIGDNLIAVEVGVGAFVIAEHFVHLRKGSLVIGI